MSRSALGLLAWLALSAGAAEPAGEDAWNIFPSVENARAHIKDYVPTLEKHFKFADGVLTASSFLGEEFYAKHGLAKRSFSGVGHIWATNAAWPQDLADFELTLEYRCESTDRFSDAPDMHVGFRLNPEGEGYYLSWGMLGDVNMSRSSKEAWCNIARGGRLKSGQGWNAVRLRVAGPILKAKIWHAGQPEPAHWSTETFDDWEETGEKRFHRGALALGFYGRQLFDRSSYLFKNVRIKPITPEESKQEVFFDLQSAPQGDWGGVKSLETGALDVLLLNEASIKDFAADSNLAPPRFTAEGIVLASTDGAPAFLWTTVQRGGLVVAHAKSENGARPLLAIRPEGEGKSGTTGYVDPAWQKGTLAFTLGGPRHLCGAARFDWKDGVWHGLGWASQHLMSCQVWEKDNPKNLGACIFKPENMSFDRQTNKRVGIGVAGKGSVTFKGFGGK
ncbi:MAG: hypothetical protein M5U26_12270 [Planctomycetota bacterium]|nr:hypothetical protein [Planctomycetota bacterium]